MITARCMLLLFVLGLTVTCFGQHNDADTMVIDLRNEQSSTNSVKNSESHWKENDPQDNKHGQESTSEQQQQSEPKTPPIAKNLPGPKYFNLRYNDDFSYLDGPEGSYKPDFFDPIKNIRLNENWRLTIGGEFRVRMESETNLAGFGANPRTSDTFQLYRYFVHTDWRYRNSFRIFVEGVHAHDEDRDLAPRVAADENYLDLHQAFFDWRFLGEDVPLTIRVGRQELQYGAQRLVAPLDWANVRRRFDGVKLFWSSEMWDLDLWYVKTVPNQPINFDDYNEDQDFYGAYATYKGIPNHGIDFSFLALRDTSDQLSPDGGIGDLSLYSLGSRFWGMTGPWDYDTELTGQWGKWAGDTIQAWSWSIEGGYTFKETPWTPRIGGGFDWASGDETFGDGKVGTFQQLFPLGHAYLGLIDLVARENITAAHASVSAWPLPKKVKTQAAYHAFWLNADADALYNAGGAPLRRDITGRSSEEVGHELDLTLLWRIDVHQSLLLGYSKFWSGDFISQTGSDDDPDLFYVQYSFKF